MLKLTRKLEYSLIALSHLQKQNKNRLSTTKEIAEKFAIPQEILAKTLQQLAKLELIYAVQGPYGGYKVVESIDKLSFLEFIEKRLIGLDVIKATYITRAWSARKKD